MNSELIIINAINNEIQKYFNLNMILKREETDINNITKTRESIHSDCIKILQKNLI